MPNYVTELLMRMLMVPNPSRREAAFAAFVRGELEKLGLAVHEDEAGPAIGGDSGNLIAHVSGTTAAEPLLLNAHLDSVAPAEQPLRPEIRGDEIRSASGILGADDKAGVAVILAAVREVLADNRPHPPLDLVFTVAEEVGLSGAQHLDCERLRARVGFVLDGHGPVGGLTVRAPAHERIEAMVTGRAAHAGVAPENGISAIAIAARAIAAMRLGRVDEETTANIGVIEGGTAINVIPERCRLSGEARSHDEKKLAAQTQSMLEALHEAAADAGGAIEVEVERMYGAFRLEESSPVVAIGRRAAASLGRELVLLTSGGGSDASSFNAHGLETGVVSVGYEDMHGPGEHLPLAELSRAVEFTLALVQSAATHQ